MCHHRVGGVSGGGGGGGISLFLDKVKYGVGAGGGAAVAVGVSMVKILSKDTENFLSTTTRFASPARATAAD